MLDWRSPLPDDAAELPIITFLPAYQCQELVGLCTGILTQHGPKDSLLVQKWNPVDTLLKLIAELLWRWQAFLWRRLLTKSYFPGHSQFQTSVSPKLSLSGLSLGRAPGAGAELPFLFSSVIFLLIFFTMSSSSPLNKGSSVTNSNTFIPVIRST